MTTSRAALEHSLRWIADKGIAAWTVPTIKLAVFILAAASWNAQGS